MKPNEELFTEKGRKVLVNYTSTLVELYFANKVWPLQQKIVGLDIPNHSLNIKSKEDLAERIKQMYCLLGLTGMTIELKSGTKLTLDFKVNKDGS